MTPAQLARKRANDREAQRAIRARTKEHIERLERELNELKKGRLPNNDARIVTLEKKNHELEVQLLWCKDQLRAVGIPVGRAGMAYPKTLGCPIPTS